MGTLIPRDGAQMLLPQGAIFGTKVMITNEFSGSGGDLLPWFFRRFTGGKLVGTRTWGGVVGLSGIPELMDGGGVTAPLALIANTNGAYEVENQGVPPDFEIQMDPKLVRQGADPQLEKAIAVILDELQKSPMPEVKRPPYPKL